MSWMDDYSDSWSHAGDSYFGDGFDFWEFCFNFAKWTVIIVFISIVLVIASYFVLNYFGISFEEAFKFLDSLFSK